MTYPQAQHAAGVSPFRTAWFEVAKMEAILKQGEANGVEKEGTVPVFVLRVTDDAGKMVERKYKLNTPIVRRVLAPGEQKESSVVSHRSSGKIKKKKH